MNRWTDTAELSTDELRYGEDTLLRTVAGWGRALAIATCLLLTAGCATTTSISLRSLAPAPPTPCSVLVTGGAFLSPRDPSESALDRTFVNPTAEGVHEALTLNSVTAALRTARTFTRIELDTRDPAVRRRFAEFDGALPVGDASVRDLLSTAAAAGHDYLVFVDRMLDGPVQEFGINGRWPITAIAWLALGVGLVIPDHTFESSAELRISVRDVHSGEVVYRRVFDGDPIDLSLVDRTDIWGLLTSILVPPFWVGNDEELVVERVRRATQQRLLYLLAQDLKGTAFRDQLRVRAPAEIVVETVEDRGSGRRLLVRARALEGLSLIRVRLDGRRFDGPQWEPFATEFLNGGTVEDDEASVYEAVLTVPEGSRFVQVLAQTVGGRVASTTIDLRDPREGVR